MFNQKICYTLEARNENAFCYFTRVLFFKTHNSYNDYYSKSKIASYKVQKCFRCKKLDIYFNMMQTWKLEW